MQCCAAVRATYRSQQTTPPPPTTLNGGEEGGVWILLFSEVTLLEYNVSTILSQIVAPPTQTEDSTRQILTFQLHWLPLF